MKPSKEVAELHGRLAKSLRPKYGVHWIARLAASAEVKEKSIRTLFARGRRLPPYDLDAAARALLGVTATESTDDQLALLRKILDRLAPLDKLPEQINDLRKEILILKEPPNRRGAGGASATAP